MTVRGANGAVVTTRPSQCEDGIDVRIHPVVSSAMSSSASGDFLPCTITYLEMMRPPQLTPLQQPGVRTELLRAENPTTHHHHLEFPLKYPLLLGVRARTRATIGARTHQNAVISVIVINR